MLKPMIAAPRVTCTATIMKVAYPASHQPDQLGNDLLSLKIARHSPCSSCVSCTGMHPPPNVKVVADEFSDSTLGDLEQYGSDDEDEEVSSYFQVCGCGHDAKTHNADESILGTDEFKRRGRVAIRLDELLQDSGRLLDFEYTDDDILSLRKQMGHPRSGLTVFASNSSPADASRTHSSVPLSGSPASSVLSDPPQQSVKKRNYSLSSSLSDNDDDDEEDKPLAARMTNGSRTPGKRTGKQAPVRTAKKSKKSHTVQPSSSSLDSTLKPNGKPITTSEARARVEDKMDEDQINRLTAGVALDSVGRSSAAPPIRAEKPSAAELRKGYIKIIPVENNHEPQSLILLSGLKTLFQKQLPKMPREYIARLVYDSNSRGLAIVKRGLKVVGGICYRPFPHRLFAEIVFFATNSADQDKGYGGMLMDHFKAHVQKAYPTMTHFLTYADNYAVGYFEKQGFSKEIKLDRSVWAGYIKDYEGGTIMQCALIPKIDYLNKPALFKMQQEAIMTKIRQLSTSHIVHKGLPQFQTNDPNVKPVDPRDVPGLRETGWTFEMAEKLTHRNNKDKDEGLIRMEKLITELIAHPRAWPFLKPVNEKEVPDYYQIIKHPMDLGTIKSKVSNNEYANFQEFADDVQLVVDNCKIYNPEQTVYARAAVKIEEAFKDMVKNKDR